MLSIFPKQEIKSFGEWLIIPIIDFLSLSLFPLRMVTSIKTEKYSLAIGQFMLFNKKVYEDIGGFEAVKGNVLDDISLAVNTKKNGYKLVLARSLSLITCRMYRNFKESFIGLSRSFYIGANMAPWLFTLSLDSFLYSIQFNLLISFPKHNLYNPSGLFLNEQIYYFITSKTEYNFKLNSTSNTFINGGNYRILFTSHFLSKKDCLER